MVYKRIINKKLNIQHFYLFLIYEQLFMIKFVKFRACKLILELLLAKDLIICNLILKIS